MEEKNEIMIVDEASLKDKIYTIRGQQVMLDFDLAEIYGYSVSAFNQQVKRNTERFPDDFIFELSPSEMESLSKSQNVISIQTSGRKGGRAKPVKAFTESGIYMLMTVLKGDLAIEQSKTLIRLFKSMKDYIIENQQLMITQRDYVALATKVNENSSDIKEIKDKLGETVTRTELSDFMKLFDSGIDHEEILIFNGEPLKADAAYQKIYRKAKEQIVVIDDYIGTKTLQHLAHARQKVDVIVISDNRAKPPLRKSEYLDYQSENPKNSISFIKTSKKVHDRYIILDSGTENTKVYHCGGSSKDAGVKKIMTITEINGVKEYEPMLRELLGNPELTLK